VFACGAKEAKMTDPNTQYLMTRAKQEAAMAARARHPSAAAAHRILSLRYSARAVMDLAEEVGQRPLGARAVAASR